MSYTYYSGIPYTPHLQHHGILGQKWGQRRFQNPDGTLTPEGRKRYNKGDGHRGREIIKTGARVVGSGIAKGARAVGSVAGKGARRLGEGIERGIKTKLAEKLPFFLNDEELERYNNRLVAENKYKQAQAAREDMERRREEERENAERRQKMADMQLKQQKIDLKKKQEGDHFIKNLVKDVASSAIKTTANKALNKWLDDKLQNEDDRERDALNLDKLRFDIAKNKAESAVNELKSDMGRDATQQYKDLARIRTLEKKRNDATRTLKNDKYVKEYVEHLNNKPDGTASQDEQDKWKEKRDWLKREFDMHNQKRIKEMRKMNSEIVSLLTQTAERRRSLDERRTLLDNTLDKNNIRSVADFMKTLGKDKVKKVNSLLDYLDTLDDEDRDEVLGKINSHYTT